MDIIKSIVTLLGVIVTTVLGVLILFATTLIPLMVWTGVILVTTWLMAFIGIPTSIGLWISGLTLLGIEVIHLLNLE